MLQPHSRRLLSESLKAPPNYQLNYVVGTTYSLDLFAMLQAPVAFAFSDAHQTSGLPIADPLVLLKAVREYAHRMLIFCQAGQIKVPKSFPQLAINLEESIAEVSLKNDQGVFHPKVWFLRFIGEDESVKIRFLCLTRNLTYDKSWDTVVCLEGDLTERKNAIANNHPLGEFVEALPNLAARKLGRLWKGRLDELAADVRRVHFEIPEPFETIRFHPLGISTQTVWPFPQRSDKLLAISPFVSESTLQELCSAAKEAQLVSRPDQLELLKPSTIDSFSAGAWTLSQQAEPEPAELDSNEIDTDTSTNAEPIAPPKPMGASPGSPTSSDVKNAKRVESGTLSGLHAKLYIFDQGRTTSIFAGSANATHAAFSENVEFLTELSGKKSTCGVDVILGLADKESEGPRAASLSTMLERFKSDSTREDTEELQQTREFELQAALIARRLVEASPTVTCESSDQSDSFRLTVAPTRRLKVNLAGYTINGKLLSLVKHPWKSIDLGQERWIEYESLSLLSLTGFVAFEVVDPERQFARQFVLNCPLLNAPPDREARLVESLLSDPEKVLKYLLMLLGGDQLPDDSSDGTSPGAKSRKGQSRSASRATLLESLLRSMSDDPKQIEQFDKIVETLSATEAGRRRLPPDLDSIWIPMRDVWREQNPAKTKRGSTK